MKQKRDKKGKFIQKQKKIPEKMTGKPIPKVIPLVKPKEEPKPVLANEVKKLAEEQKAFVGSITKVNTDVSSLNADVQTLKTLVSNLHESSLSEIKGIKVIENNLSDLYTNLAAKHSQLDTVHTATKQSVVDLGKKLNQTERYRYDRDYSMRQGESWSLGLMLWIAINALSTASSSFQVVGYTLPVLIISIPFSIFIAICYMEAFKPKEYDYLMER